MNTKAIDRKYLSSENPDVLGLRFVFTGKLKTMTRKEARAAVKAAGAYWDDQVDGFTDYLVSGKPPSARVVRHDSGNSRKMREALDRGIQIISETDFVKMLLGVKLN